MLNVWLVFFVIHLIRSKHYSYQQNGNHKTFKKPDDK